MARLIDAEKLWLTTEYAEDGKVHKYYEQFEVDNAPTIDAEPVRHGWWTVTYLKHIELANDEGHVYIQFAKCSECGNEAIMQFVDYNESFKEWYTDYCPHCGAKMNEENDEN